MMQNSACLYSDQNASVRVYERNLTAYCAALSLAGGGYVQRDTDAVLTMFPYTFWSNGLVSPRFTEVNVRRRIDEVLSVFRKRKREVWFHVGPSSSPDNLAVYLKQRGLWNFHNRPFCICALDQLISGFRIPDGVTIMVPENYEIFKQHPHPIYGFATSTRKKHIFNTYQALDRMVPRCHWMFVAYKDEMPIGVAIAYIQEDIAGIYDVEVQEAYQRQGIGTALLQHVCLFARDAGARVAALAASEKGALFYPRFGFRIIGRYPTYYYSLRKQKLDAERLNESW